MKKIIFVVIGLLVISAVSFAVINHQTKADSEEVRRLCLIGANQVFLDYLEDNSTTYRLDGAIINLPKHDNVIEQAKQILKEENSKC